MTRRLPPLNALRAFEAAGRLSSFSLAAEELHVTQGAISRQVRLLESHLGEPVFIRGARGVTLTEHGKRYLEVVSESFDRIEECFSGHAGRRQLSINLLPSSATLWLQDRLSAFELEHPDIRLTVSTSQRPVNFDQDAVDLAMRVGTLPSELKDDARSHSDLDMVTSWNGVEAICVWREEVSPFCSRAYLESLGGLDSIEDLARATLIHNETRPYHWRNWFKSQGQPYIEGANQIHVGQRYRAVLAAREGLGVACVPTKDIEMLSWRDELVQPFKGTFTTGQSYYLLHRRDSVRLREVDALCRWVMKTMASER